MNQWQGQTLIVFSKCAEVAAIAACPVMLKVMQHCPGGESSANLYSLRVLMCDIRLEPYHISHLYPYPLFWN